MLAYLEDEKGEEFKTFAHVADALRNGAWGGLSRLRRVAMVGSCAVSTFKLRTAYVDSARCHGC